MRKERPPRSFLLKTSAAVICCLFFFPTIYLIVRNFTEGARPGELIFSSRTLEPLQRTLLLARRCFCLRNANWEQSCLARDSDQSIYFGDFGKWHSQYRSCFPSFIGAAAFNRTLSKGGSVADFLENFGVHSGFQFRGFWGAWFVLTLFTYPYVYLPVAAKLRHLPVSLEESARVLGNRPLAIFPKCLPASAAAEHHLRHAFSNALHDQRLRCCSTYALRHASEGDSHQPARSASCRASYQLDLAGSRRPSSQR